jgi:hypothetical protein
MGSWSFIVIQSLLFGGWIALNAIAFVRHWDPCHAGRTKKKRRPVSGPPQPIPDRVAQLLLLTA